MNTNSTSVSIEEGRLTSREYKKLEPRKITMIAALVSGKDVQVPVSNQTDRPIEIQANELLSRRVTIAQPPPTTPEPLYRPLTYDDIKPPEALTTEQQAELLVLLNEHRACFALSMDELGCTDLGTMDISLKSGSVPYAAKPYRVSQAEKDEIRQHVQTWRDHGIVEDSTSAYAAPVLLVRKKTGESCLVVDYRRLNEQTVKQVYPLPNIDDLLE